MTEEIDNDCRFCENGRCRVYPWTCDYDDYCSSNEECPIKEMIVKFKRLKQENKELGRKAFLAEQNVRTTAATFCEKDNKIIELEQENKVLKSNTNVLNDYITKNEQLKTNIDSLVKKNEKLKQENTELKKENENYKLYGSSTIVAPVNHTNTEYDLLYGQSMLYKSALEEIRQINNKWLKRWMNDSDELMGFEEIGNKLNEVLNGI